MKLIFVILLLIAGDFKDPVRISELELKIKNHTDDLQSRLELAEIFINQENFVEAKENLSQAQQAMEIARQDSCNAKYYYLWGLYWDLNDNIAAASEYYLDATNCDSSFSQAWHNLGYIQEIFGNYNQMLYYFKKALLESEDSALFWGMKCRG